MENWFTVIVILSIVGVVLDGLRRMRLARRENIRLSKEAQEGKFADIRVSNSEFPSGGARVVGRRDPKDAESLNETVRKSFEATKVTIGAPQRIPEQVALNLEASVPMLMDSVEDTPEEDVADPLPEDDNQNANTDHPHVDVQSKVQEEEHEPALGDMSDLDYELGEVRRKEPGGAKLTQSVQALDLVSEERVNKKHTEKEKSQKSSEAAFQEPDDVLIINVMAKKGERFQGEALLQALMDLKFKFGAMDIFHRHAENDGDAPVLYSLANMVVPGTFNLAEMSKFETPGVSIFLSLPVAGESLAAYNDLASTAKSLAEKLGGELKDENRSVMTNQTIEHGRQRVIEYERKRKLARA